MPGKTRFPNIGEKAFKDSFADPDRRQPGEDRRPLDRQPQQHRRHVQADIRKNNRRSARQKSWPFPAKIASKTFWEPVKALAHFIRSTISGKITGRGPVRRAGPFQMGSPSLMMARLGTSPLEGPGRTGRCVFWRSHDHGQLVIRGAQGQVGAQIAVGDVNMHAVAVIGREIRTRVLISALDGQGWPCRFYSRLTPGDPCFRRQTSACRRVRFHNRIAKQKLF